MMPLGSILLCLFAGWIAKPKLADALLGADARTTTLFAVWQFVCRFVAPLAITLIIVAGLLD
jgi:NSS family neurotransmitter:Na+ symporter